MKNYALFSVSDKTGIEALAKKLQSEGFSLLATGKTSQQLQNAGFEVTDVSQLTQEPERFEGRLKTLHHMILGGILLRPGQDESQWPYPFRIGAVVCNFYPFSEKVSEVQNDKHWIEWIDIGGPTMVRAAAKNFEHVYIFTNPDQYNYLDRSEFSDRTVLRERLSLEAFENVSRLDSEISEFFVWKQSLSAGSGLTTRALRYGENAHQAASFVPHSDVKSKVLGNLSFNNWRDSEAALRFIKPFQSPAVAIIKHQTLCGAAVGLENSFCSEVFLKAWEGDDVSRFGSVIALNFLPSKELTQNIFEKKFIEVILLPRSSESEQWAEGLIAKKPQLRIVLVDWASLLCSSKKMEIYQGYLGKLKQEPDSLSEQEIRTLETGSFSEFHDLVGQWMAAASKSNAMVLTAEEITQKIVYLVGSGQGQPNRVEALQLLALPRAQKACARLGLKMKQLRCFSDGFLPFTDTLYILSQSGVSYLVQPGGSKADADVIEAAKKLNVEMKMTGRRHFWH